MLTILLNMIGAWGMSDYVLVEDCCGRTWNKLEGSKLYNRCEGYTYLSSDMHIVEIVQAEDWLELDWSKTSLVIPENQAVAGWLDRSGKFHGCARRGHDRYAELILGKTVAQLEKEGWTRVYGPPNSYPAYTCLYRLGLSVEQRNWLSLRGYKIHDYD